MSHGRCKHPREIIAGHKNDQRIKEAVKTAEEPAQECTQTCKHQFHLIDHILHNSFLSALFGA